MSRHALLAYHDALIASHKALSADAYHAQELPKAIEMRAAAAKLLRAAINLRSRQREYVADEKGQRCTEKGRLVGCAARELDIAITLCTGAAK